MITSRGQQILSFFLSLTEYLINYIQSWWLWWWWWWPNFSLITFFFCFPHSLFFQFEPFGVFLAHDHLLFFVYLLTFWVTFGIWEKSWIKKVAWSFFLKWVLVLTSCSTERGQYMRFWEVALVSESIITYTKSKTYKSLSDLSLTSITFFFFFFLWNESAVADVILWRKKNVSVGIVTVTIASWMVFETFAYTIFTLLSSVLLLLLSILFLWSKSASILNRYTTSLYQERSWVNECCSFLIQFHWLRPSPPLPEFQISEAMAEEASKLLRIRVNKLLQVSHDIAMGRDSELFIKAAVSLFLISFIGSLTDFQTLCHTGK